MKVSIVEWRRTHSFPRCTKVVVDVYRATTTIPIVLMRGAERVITAGTIEEARLLMDKYPGSVGIGERYGIKLKGFELNNSPRACMEYDFNGKIAVLTSTNGTKAIKVVQGSGDVFVSSFVNFKATVAALGSLDEVQIVLSGRPGGSADEDREYGNMLMRALEGKDPMVDETIRVVRRGVGSKRLLFMGAGKEISVSLNVDSVPFACIFRDGAFYRA